MARTPPLAGPPPRQVRQLRLEYLCAFVHGTIDANALALIGTYEGVSFRLQLLEGAHPSTRIESSLLAVGAAPAVQRAIARPEVAASLTDLRARLEWSDNLLRLSRDGWPHDAIVTMSLIRLVAAVRRAVDEQHEAAERARLPGAVYRTPGGA